MTFNDKSSFDSSNVQRRRSGGGRGGAIAGGGGILVLIIGFLSMQFLGFDITQMFAPGQDSSQVQQAEDLQCTGAEANANIDCRMEGAAVTLEQYWAENAPRVGISNYVDPTVVIYDDSTSSGCGTASNAVGPFYCPSDQGIYIDTAFYTILEQRYGASGGPLAEMYVLAHEWGHHIQNLGGVLSQVSSNDTGPTSGMVRLELQADCLAGAWMGSAANYTDANGNQILKEPTREEIQTTISSAQAIGDDNIMEQAGMRVQPEKFSHGTSEQRTNWLMKGYQEGVGACNTFDVPGRDL